MRRLRRETAADVQVASLIDDLMDALQVCDLTLSPSVILQVQLTVSEFVLHSSQAEHATAVDLVRELEDRFTWAEMAQQGSPQARGDDLGALGRLPPSRL